MFDYDLYKSRCKELVSAIKGLGFGHRLYSPGFTAELFKLG